MDKGKQHRADHPSLIGPPEHNDLRAKLQRELIEAATQVFQKNELFETSKTSHVLDVLAAYENSRKPSLPSANYFSAERDRNKSKRKARRARGTNSPSLIKRDNDSNSRQQDGIPAQALSRPFFGTLVLDVAHGNLRVISSDNSALDIDGSTEANQVLVSNEEVRQNLRERLPRFLGKGSVLVALEMHPEKCDAEVRSKSLGSLFLKLAELLDAWDAGELADIGQVTFHATGAIIIVDKGLQEGDVPPLERDKEQPPSWDELSTGLAKRIAADFQNAGPGFDEKLAALRADLERLRGPVVDRLQEYLDSAEVQGKSFGSLEANQQFVARLRELLHGLDRRVECPSCNEPANLACKPSNSPSGSFKFQHPEATQRTEHGGPSTLPPLKVIRPGPST